MTRHLGAGLVVGLGCVLVGCGSDDGDAGAPVVTSVVAAATSAPAGPPSTARPGVPTAGGATSSILSTGSATPTLRGLRVRLTQVGAFDQPVSVISRPGDPNGVQVVERVGRIRTLRDGAVATAPLLDMSTRTRAGGERGLLGAVFSADGSSLYVHYTDPTGTSVVDAYSMTVSGVADPSTRRQVLALPQPYPNHNGGDLAIGPDGMLYVAFGDGGAGGDPQRYSDKLNTWLGKLLRIDPRPSGSAPYVVPADNPFVGRADAKPEIWSVGLRNPWRISFDRATGDLWIADVGQNELEEVNRARAVDGAGRGVNFGWSAFEGSLRFNEDVPADGAVPPLHEYPHGELGCSVTGGVVYRGQRITALRGAYVFADYCVPGVRALDPSSPSQAVPIASGAKAIVGFGQGPDGELYAASLDGPLYRIDPS